MFCNLSAFLLPNLENSTKRLIVVLSLVLVVSNVQAWEIIRKSGSFRLVLRAIIVCSCGLFQVLLVAECLHFTLFGIILPTIKTKSVHVLGLMNSATKSWVHSFGSGLPGLDWATWGGALSASRHMSYSALYSLDFELGFSIFSLGFRV